ncbi:SCO family protein [Aliifodinibius salicampi]|uniref:SCO family protein n=1 Tax=Fodinibius salicampi TaxID=1920655 RepID=A0ABT3PXF3_9BACT|nr:SCO family protein [Fodinibius salicampi]MCW9712542.1 SCO family protein [Fodinibius salicampi]
MKMISIILLSLFLVTSLNAQHHHAADGELGAGKISAEHSLYHLDAQWTNHRDETVKLSDFRGSPVIVVMFYGNCMEVCPILIQDAWRLYSSVDESVRGDVNVLAVSFDTENDTPEVLNNYAKYEQLDIPGWHFMISKNATVRSLAMMLGVQYSKKSDGHFAHSNLVTVLDKEGKIAIRMEGLNQPMGEAAAVINSILMRK